ncbi:tellurite resistance TerB family protein [Paenibacillus sp. GCM10023248]|uniref:tellurite resistance TerB family protein n=1 Tax=Bacillales TaxID=1385 RepID=UPI002379D794|nr:MULTISPECIES: TerB family tellurite resistance protein [Bacillales]MDD9271219.1 TerB family tellurite resistance protein [Paenibacillus sp. MAHUQ-63]MDR6881661.1 tellurite resistance protein TerB [Bacillus sp. 3255]
MSTFKSWFTSAKTGLTDQVKKFQNKDFLDAVVAGCAVVAAADGSIGNQEKEKMIGYISRSEELKVFDVSNVIARFNHYASNFEFSGLVGKQEAMKAIGKFSNKPEVGRIIIAVCCAIGAADGDFDDSEKRVVRDICATLSLNPAEFSL